LLSYGENAYILIKMRFAVRKDFFCIQKYDRTRWPPRLRPGRQRGSLRRSPRPPSGLGRGHPFPDATLLSAFGVSILAPSALDTGAFSASNIAPSALNFRLPIVVNLRNDHCLVAVFLYFLLVIVVVVVVVVVEVVVVLVIVVVAVVILVGAFFVVLVLLAVAVVVVVLFIVVVVVVVVVLVLSVIVGVRRPCHYRPYGCRRGPFVIRPPRRCCCSSSRRFFCCCCCCSCRAFVLF